MRAAAAASLTLVLVFHTAVILVESGCRRTNPIWTTNRTQDAVPMLTILPGSPPKLEIGMDPTTVVAYAQCIDQVELVLRSGDADEEVVLCSKTGGLNATLCTVDKSSVCLDGDVSLWLSLTNEGHLDGRQVLFAPTLTKLNGLTCASAILSPGQQVEGETVESESCRARQPVWTDKDELTPNLSALRRGGRATFSFPATSISSPSCVESFELRYWSADSRGFRSIVTKTVDAEASNDLDPKYLVPVDSLSKCKKYKYQLKAIKSNPTYSSETKGEFTSPCGDDKPQQGRTSSVRPTPTISTTKKSTTTTLSTPKAATTTTTTTTTRKTTTTKASSTSTTTMSTISTTTGTTTTEPTTTFTSTTVPSTLSTTESDKSESLSGGGDLSSSVKNRKVPFPSLIQSEFEPSSTSVVTSRIATSFEVTIDYNRLEGARRGGASSPPSQEGEVPLLRTRKDRKLEQQQALQNRGKDNLPTLYLAFLCMICLTFLR